MKPLKTFWQLKSRQDRYLPAGKAVANIYPQAEDSRSTSKLATTIVKLCYEAKKFDYLNEKLVLLAKRRGQLKMVPQ